MLEHTQGGVSDPALSRNRWCSPPLWVSGAAAGAGAAVAAVAVQAATSLVPASWKRVGGQRPAQARWTGYVLAGGAAALLIGPWMVLVLVAAPLPEVAVHTRREAAPRPRRRSARPLPLALAAPAGGGLLALAWVAFKVGALSYGRGFVIIPLMQTDAVHQYHWMTDGQFLNAVALGQITPGPVGPDRRRRRLRGGRHSRRTARRRGGLAPSFLFVIFGGRHFDALRADPRVQAFFGGASPAVIGAVAGSAVPLAVALQHAWKYGVPRWLPSDCLPRGAASSAPSSVPARSVSSRRPSAGRRAEQPQRIFRGLGTTVPHIVHPPQGGPFSRGGRALRPRRVRDRSVLPGKGGRVVPFTQEHVPAPPAASSRRSKSWCAIVIYP
ncbi:chromate transporter [Kitasatospora aureofaciens]|uniref:chromate transporter n=1 Tax=Kitasatospora aureofaciens TaxID=1894 RepID=UPI000AFD09B0|nr:chromate transporter [Kitasatospora aureofaciens]